MTTNVPISNVIGVQNAVISSTSSGFIPAGLILSQNSLLPSLTVLPFTSALSVGQYFGTGSTEYKNAVKYFNAETITVTTPPNMLFYRYATATGLSPYTRGSALTSADFTTLKTVSVGTLAVKFNGTTTTTTATIDLTSASSFSAMAGNIQSALVTAGLTTATVTFNSVSNAFIVGSTVIGDSVDYIVNSPITAGNSLAQYMKITTSSGSPILSQGVIASTDSTAPAINMNSVISQNTNWVGFTTNFDVSGSVEALAGYPTAMGLVEWQSTQNAQYAYFAWSTEDDVIAFPQSTTSLPYFLATNGWGVVAPTGQITFNTNVVVYYCDAIADPLAGIVMGQLGTGASINYNLFNATKSFDAKTYAGVIPSIITQQAYTQLLLNGCNGYTSFSSKANAFVWSENGSIGGNFLWLDNIYNQAWFNDAITVAEAGLKAGLSIMPFTSLSSLEAVIIGVCQQGVNNGVVSAGNTFSASEKAQLIAQLGVDPTPTLFASGYFVKIFPPTSQSIAQRKLAPVYIVYSNGGSINTISNILELVI